MAAVPEGSGFEPLMTLYLTEDTTPAEVEAAAKSGLVAACKLYPAGATTNSDNGVKDFNNITDTLAAMAEVGTDANALHLCMPLVCTRVMRALLRVLAYPPRVTPLHVDTLGGPHQQASASHRTFRQRQRPAPPKESSPPTAAPANHTTRAQAKRERPTHAHSRSICMGSLCMITRQLGLPLLVHGEVVEAHVDIFDREKQFLQEKLAPLQAKMPELKVVLEHATTKDAVEYVLSNPSVGCTITPQHLLYNRNALLVGGLKPHFYCLPILKRELHRTSIHRTIHPRLARTYVKRLQMMLVWLWWDAALVVWQL
jgi:dihydroorotase